jgi:hypothetical protein
LNTNLIVMILSLYVMPYILYNWFLKPWL